MLPFLLCYHFMYVLNEKTYRISEVAIEGQAFRFPLEYIFPHQCTKKRAWRICVRHYRSKISRIISKVPKAICQTKRNPK